MTFAESRDVIAPTPETEILLRKLDDCAQNRHSLQVAAGAVTIIVQSLAELDDDLQATDAPQVQLRWAAMGDFVTRLYERGSDYTLLAVALAQLLSLHLQTNRTYLDAPTDLARITHLLGAEIGREQSAARGTNDG